MLGGVFVAVVLGSASAAAVSEVNAAETEPLFVLGDMREVAAPEEGALKVELLIALAGAPKAAASANVLGVAPEAAVYKKDAVKAESFVELATRLQLQPLQRA